MKKNKITYLLLLFSVIVTSQKMEYTALNIPENLKENANSVIRFQKTDITINSVRSISIKKENIITVLNESGLKNIDAVEYYDNSSRVSSIEAIIYDAFGNEIKKIRRKDFVDHSLADGFSILSDNRMLYLDYTPVQYPFTIVYKSSIETSNTAFIKKWHPVNDYYESVQKSIFSIQYKKELGFKYKENNFQNYTISKSQNDNSITFSIENVSAEKREEFANSAENNWPNLMVANDVFSLEGLEGNSKDWNMLGKWMYDNFLLPSEELSPETIAHIKSLVANETDALKKAEIIYQYVQNKTRYVSIQLGIGGWKPMLAKDVDRLGYGDCKALSNYTRVLLKNVGVDSYYTVIYAGETKKDINQDFVSIQGNHVCLTIPYNNKNYQLECTSQKAPFAYQGDFTDDRYALIVKSDGSQIIKTNSFEDINNSQTIKGKVEFKIDGSIESSIEIISKGIKYDNKYNLETLSKEKLDEYYKETFRNLINLKLINIKLINNKKLIEFKEELQLKNEKYVVKNGNLFLFPINIFSANQFTSMKIKNRKYPIEISRGFLYNDEIEINIPSELKIDNIPTAFQIEEKYGIYKLTIEKETETKFIVKRYLLIKRGIFQSNEIESYKKFIDQISKFDNAKIILIQN